MKIQIWRRNNRSVLVGTVITVLLSGLTACSDSATTPPAAEFAQLARAIIHRQDQVAPEDLADWVIQGREDLMLVDVRPQSEFEAGHIDGAVSLPLTYLVEPQVLQALPLDKRVILYSNGSRKASQAAVMLRLAGLDAYALTGGYNYWNEHILHPQGVAGSADDEKLVDLKRQAVACYFSGNYASAQAPASPAPASTGHETGAATAPASGGYMPPLAPAAGMFGTDEEEEDDGLLIEEGC